MLPIGSSNNFGYPPSNPNLSQNSDNNNNNNNNDLHNNTDSIDIDAMFGPLPDTLEFNTSTTTTTTTANASSSSSTNLIASNVPAVVVQQATDIKIAQIADDTLKQPSKFYIDQEDLTDCISLDVMTEPVILSPCGHTYDAEQIYLLIKKNVNSNVSKHNCPTCRGPLRM